MNLLDWINQGIDALTNTASPSIDALGLPSTVPRQ